MFISRDSFDGSGSTKTKICRSNRWLDRPPSLKMKSIRHRSQPAHRRIFVRIDRGADRSPMVEVAAEESETLEIFKQLLVG